MPNLSISPSLLLLDTLVRFSQWCSQDFAYVGPDRV